jgi:tripartite-type tricarboxylate transporter receptor subunit TctC
MRRDAVNRTLAFSRRQLVFAAGAVIATGRSFAQTPDYPKGQAVRLILPFAAGSASDTTARIMADELQKALGGTFVVENRPGAGGIIGTELGAKAPPDGYSLILTSSSTHSLAPFLYKKVPYDPVKDFIHIGNWIDLPFVLVVHPDVPARSVQEFVDHAAKNPGKLAYGYGTPSSQLGAELLNSMAGIRTLGVSYKSHPAAVSDLVAGQTQFMVLDISAAIGQLKAGRLRALGVTSKKRLSFLPDIPSIAESGYPEYQYSAWIGLAAPVGTPRAIIDKLSAAGQKRLVLPEVQQRFTAQYIPVAPNTQQEQEAFVKTMVEVWRKRFQEWKIEPQ